MRLALLVLALAACSSDPTPVRDPYELGDDQCPSLTAGTRDQHVCDMGQDRDGGPRWIPFDQCRLMASCGLPQTAGWYCPHPALQACATTRGAGLPCPYPSFVDICRRQYQAP